MIIAIKTDILPDHQSAQRGNDGSAPAPSFAGMLQCRVPSRSATSDLSSCSETRERIYVS